MHASEVEVEGIAVLEAMRAGLPAVITSSRCRTTAAWPAGCWRANAAETVSKLTIPVRSADLQRRQAIAVALQSVTAAMR